MSTYKLIVSAEKLNKRSIIPSQLPDKEHISGVVFKDFQFIGEEVISVPNPNLGKWFKDSDGSFYWAGGLKVLSLVADEEDEQVPNETMEKFEITPKIKKKIEQVINAFETGSATGNYGAIVKYKDYKNPHTGELEVQVTFGRSQTTEFGHLKTLVSDYVAQHGTFANILQPYISRVGQKPSLASDALFCDTLKKAGKTDPIMQQCQDGLFEEKYYRPAFNWFSNNGFTLPLSMLVVYDSFIHSGTVLPFLRKRFNVNTPATGGDEKEWIKSYVQVRHEWLRTHSNPILRNTIYRMQCFKDTIEIDNWSLSAPIKANGVTII